MKLLAYCETCNHRHPIDYDVDRPNNQPIADWYTKHAAHKGVGVMWPQRTQKPGWVDRLKAAWRFVRRSPRLGFEPGHVSAFRTDYGEQLHPNVHAIAAMLPNATVKTTYAASAAPTLTLASLAASSTLLAGRESTAVSNASNLYLDYLVGGFFKQAATNTAAGTIKVAVVGALNDTPTWPDVFDGTDSTETVTTQAIYDSSCVVIASIVTAATASAVNPFKPVSIAQFHGFQMPVQWVYFVSHNAQTTTNAWDATEGSHSVKHTGVYLTVA